ncbi:MAG: DUF4261 domain-containing protein [Alphaproteobacteria bacterium]|nr:DUF4261 domain-containing protein [Alphaproteobacteria bacterium]
MGDRFIAYLACEGLAPVSPSALAEQIERLFPSAPLRARAVSGASPLSAGGGFLLEFEGSLVSVIAVDNSLPRDAYERALRLDRVWPAAGEAMASHSAHVIVATLKEANSHLEALNGAAQVTLTVAALATLVPGVAVVWANGDVITRTDRFSEAAHAFAQRQIRPDIWIGFDWLDGPPLQGGQRTLALTTTGLTAFVGREIEWLPAALPPTTIARRVFGVCQYLIVSGMVLKDGETVGVSESERIRVRFAERGQRGAPVIQLTMEIGPVAGRPRAHDQAPHISNLLQ